MGLTGLKRYNCYRVAGPLSGSIGALSRYEQAAHGARRLSYEQKPVALGPCRCSSGMLRLTK